MIYLDNAATTLIKPITVQHAVIRAMNTMASPGRGAHEPAMLASEEVFNCRLSASKLFGVENAEDIVFTQNATHALNIAIFSLIKPGDKVVISGFEHNSVTRPLRAAGADITVAGRNLFDSNDTLNSFDMVLNGADAAVCTCVSNVFGYELPIYEISRLCAERGVPLIIDASQAAGVMELDAKRLNAPYIAMPGHKGLYGPQGTGILISSDNTKPMMFGGSGSESVDQDMPVYLPDRLEAGTHNVCGIAGLRAGIDFVLGKGTENIRQHERRLLSLMTEELTHNDNIEIFASEHDNQAGVLSVRVRDMNCEELADRLASRGVCVRSGLHCAPFAHKSVGTLETGTVRFSFSAFNTENDVHNACAVVSEAVGN